MNILMSNEFYSDTLLALGIASAYDVPVTHMNMNYVFGDDFDEPIKFPEISGENEDVIPPFTYHRFKAKAINSFAGKSLLAMLETQWNTLRPTYPEIAELILNPYISEDEIKESRLWRDATNPESKSATFRPLEMKGFNNTKSSGLGSLTTLSEFWLKDALRAIGFLTYAQPKLHLRDNQKNRWQVYVPTVANMQFSDMMLHMPSFDMAIATEVYMHTVASELQIGNIVVVRYAELNAMARTFIDRAVITPRALSPHAISNIRYTLNALSQGTTATELAEASKWILDTIENRDIGSLAKLQMRLASYADKSYMKQLDTDVIEDLLTCEHITQATASAS